MKEKIKYYLPRVLGLLYILFIGIFALDVFEEAGFFKIIIALLIRLVPNFILGILLWYSWRKNSYIGGILFLVLGIGFTIFFHTYKVALNFILISGPLFLMGLLFIYESK